MSLAFDVERLAPRHDRAGFRSGVEPLDRYLQADVGQDVRRRVSACFVAVTRGTGKVAGYSTLAMAAALLSDLPEPIAVERCAAAEIAAFAVVVDAKYEKAAAFYRHHGFLTLNGDAGPLFLPLDGGTVRR